MRIVYKDENLTFHELLARDGTVTVRHRNLQKLAIDMYKIHLSPAPMQALFTEKINPYNLRDKCSWESDYLRTVKYGTETVRNMGSKTWENVPNEIRQSASLLEFKTKIKKWKPKGCRCRLRRPCIHNLGFL